MRMRTLKQLASIAISKNIKPGVEDAFYAFCGMNTWSESIVQMIVSEVLMNPLELYLESVILQSREYISPGAAWCKIHEWFGRKRNKVIHQSVKNTLNAMK